MPKNALCRKTNEEVNTISSLEVAEMIEKPHDQLMRSIRNYIEIIGNDPSAKLQTAEFFIESAYIDKQNQERPCYLLTKKGCDMVANKMTGAKGIIFTAKYVKRFNDMEQAIHSLDVQQLESSYILLNERFNEFSESLTEKINKIEAQAEFNHRPSHATKLNWNKVIKNYAKCQADEENIKHIVFAKFGIGKWEDLTADKFSEIFGYIREIAEKANLINQVGLFDK